MDQEMAVPFSEVYVLVFARAAHPVSDICAHVAIRSAGLGPVMTYALCFFIYEDPPRVDPGKRRVRAGAVLFSLPGA